MMLSSTFLSNAFLLLVPVLVWNILFAQKLPEPFGSGFDTNIPPWLLLAENICRPVVFLMPLAFRIDLTRVFARPGFWLYLGGLGIYFLSWIMLIYFPEAGWSTNLLGVTAPAYTPLIWLAGIALMGTAYYFPLTYSKWHYITPTLMFLLFHITHAVMAYSNIK